MNLKINFRQGRTTDNIQVAPLIVSAMGDLVYKFIGKTDYNAACELFEYFVTQENNQYSYQNLYVAEINAEIAGIILAYDGAYLDILRQPFLLYLKEKFEVFFDSIENETNKGEIYIDCISVAEKFQGKGIAGKLIEYLSKNNSTKSELPLGLIVERYNTKALKAYSKAGFHIIGEKIFMGQSYLHMQKAIKSPA